MQLLIIISFFFQLWKWSLLAALWCHHWVIHAKCDLDIRKGLSKFFSSVNVFWYSHCATSFSWPWAWGWAIHFLKSSENRTNSEEKQSTKSLEYSSINLGAAPRMASLLSSVRFLRKPHFSWMPLYASNWCCRAGESLSMNTRNTSTLIFCLGENTVSDDVSSSR